MHDYNNTMLIEAVERYIMGEMNPDERLYFENLRKSDSEIDQMVVEHTMFLQKMNRLNEWQKFNSSLQQIHTELTETGKINSIRLKGKAKITYLYNRYKKTIAVAACIAGLTAILINSIVWSVAPKTSPDDLVKLNRDIKLLSQKADIQGKEISSLKEQGSEKHAPIEIPYTKGGTGFIIDGKGFLVTNSHVINNAKHVAVQNAAGKEFIAEIVYSDPSKDIAILKITDDDFKPLSNTPYAFSRSTVGLAEPIITMGYPRETIVYGQGYVSAHTGYNGDTLSYQLYIPAEYGNSGSPIINNNGEVIGILNGRQKDANEVAFAIQTRNIFSALNEAKKHDTGDSTFQHIKLNTKSTLSGVNRAQQVKKLQDYIYMVKVN